jgi:shikimate kinase
MGSGKSYTSHHLQKILQMPSIDMDEVLVAQENMSVKEIFETKGEPYFRKIENEYLKKINPSGSYIISTGGGVPCFFDNIELMNEKGITVYLNRDKELNMRQLYKRKERRPLIATLTDEELSDYYDIKLEERTPYYSKALLHVGNADTETIAMMIRSLKL